MTVTTSKMLLEKSRFHPTFSKNSSNFVGSCSYFKQNARNISSRTMKNIVENTHSRAVRHPRRECGEWSAQVEKECGIFSSLSMKSQIIPLVFEAKQPSMQRFGLEI
jgi:hypothetical protein